MKNKKILGTTFILVIVILVSLSIAMIASLSYPRAQKEYGDSLYFLKKHLAWVTIGGILFLVTQKINYKAYSKFRKILYNFGLLLLVLVLAIGKTVNGAKRWLDLGVMSIQPSELAKLILILSLSGELVKLYREKKGKRKKIYNGRWENLLDKRNIVLYPGIYIVLVIFEKALSNTMQIVIIALVLYIVSEIKMIYTLIGLVIVPIFGGISIIAQPYRMARIISFLSGNGDTYQATQSLIAIGNGGLFGKFYGNGIQKYFYLPEIHTDYIFSGIAEELGLVGVLVIIFLYLLLLGIILYVALNIKDIYAKYVSTGIFVMLATQVFGNMSVALGIIPSTGIPLPILSYGGSGMFIVMTTLGIMFNIIKAFYKQEEKVSK